MTRDHIVACSSNADGTIIGRAHTNPMLDARMYIVEIAGVEFKELTTNIIAESMYT